MIKKDVNRDKRVTIKDVAALAGVTPAVVSRLINRDPDLAILETTKARIYSAVEKTGYKPNPMARGLRRKKTGMVGLIIVDFTNPFYGKLLRSIQDCIEREGYICLMSESREDVERTRRLVDQYLDRQVEGLILCTALENDPVVDYLESIGEKYVLATRRARNSTAGYVGFDNEKGMSAAMEYLIGLGHKRIAHITGYIFSVPAQERINGYRAALFRHGIEVSEDLIVYSDWAADNTNEIVSKLMSLSEPPTAIIAANDLIAIAALKRINELGLRVPEDVSLIGFNNNQETAITEPSLTTIESPTELLGKETAAMLLRVLSGEKSVNDSVVIDTRLVVRDSTGICKDI